MTRRFAPPSRRGAAPGCSASAAAPRAARSASCRWRAGVPLPARRRGLQPAHVPVRAVGFGEDVLARAGARAAAAGDRPADGHPRPELRLRPPGELATTPTPAWPGATGGGAAGSRSSRAASGAAGCGCTLPELDPAAQAALLGLDPIADRGEYAALADARGERQPDRDDGRKRQPGAAGWACAPNLGVDLGRLGAGQAGRCSSSRTTTSAAWLSTSVAADARGAAAGRHGVLATCGATARTPPVLIVIVTRPTTSARPSPGPAGRARHRPRPPDRRRGPQVRALPAGLDAAPAEGPENVLTQCDNLLLMRINSSRTPPSPGVFSFVPAGLIQRSVTFRQGEALIAGKISPDPALVRFGPRICERAALTCWRPGHRGGDVRVLPVPRPGRRDGTASGTRPCTVAWPSSSLLWAGNAGTVSRSTYAEAPERIGA